MRDGRAVTGKFSVRAAQLEDIPRIIEIRHAVRENRLSSPDAVTGADCAWYVQNAGFWVAENDHEVIAFSAADPRDGSIWALFTDPSQEGRGAGSALIEAACGYLRREGFTQATLTTDPNTRAEGFYHRRGWTSQGLAPNGEVQFARLLSPEG